ncbi:TusE/DsrC/DsvC family sulfur relay protein, partial [Listeria monocytogenes]|nr:TusE/DsrC/DsvC family sulfur relay protein [Listeria monocytogenes]
QLLLEFYAEFQLSPANRPLIKYVAQRLGPDKGNSLHLNHLFKGAPAKLGAKLAGLPTPSNCLCLSRLPPNIRSPSSSASSAKARAERAA